MIELVSPSLRNNLITSLLSLFTNFLSFSLPTLSLYCLSISISVNLFSLSLSLPHAQSHMHQSFCLSVNSQIQCLFISLSPLLLFLSIFLSFYTLLTPMAEQNFLFLQLPFLYSSLSTLSTPSRHQCQNLFYLSYPVTPLSTPFLLSQHPCQFFFPSVPKCAQCQSLADYSSFIKLHMMIMTTSQN
jgi:hypothetical protein